MQVLLAHLFAFKLVGFWCHQCFNGTTRGACGAEMSWAQAGLKGSGHSASVPGLPEAASCVPPAPPFCSASPMEREIPLMGSNKRVSTPACTSCGAIICMTRGAVIVPGHRDTAARAACRVSGGREAVSSHIAPIWKPEACRRGCCQLSPSACAAAWFPSALGAAGLILTGFVTSPSS